MGAVSFRNRRQRSLYQQKRHENKAFRKFKKQARYGSKLHRQRISQGILARLYGRPIRGRYNKSKKRPQRVAGFHPASKHSNVFYFRQRKKKRLARDGR